MSALPVQASTKEVQAYAWEVESREARMVVVEGRTSAMRERRVGGTAG